MKVPLTLIRAIGSEFVARKLKTVMLIFGAAAAIILAGAIWLTTMDVWWWLLTGPVMLLVLAGTIVCTAAVLVVRIVRPVLTQDQAGGVSEFVDKFERIADSIQTPMPLIVLKVGLDVLRPRRTSFIQTAVDDSASLEGDLRRLFRLIDTK